MGHSVGPLTSSTYRGVKNCTETNCFLYEPGRDLVLTDECFLDSTVFLEPSSGAW